MPSPGFRKLTITLTIVVIVTHSSCGFSLYRKTTAEADLESATDLVLQESVQIKSVKNLNDIKQGKDANTNKPEKNKYRFTSEMKFIDSTEETTANTDGTRANESINTSVADTTIIKDITATNDNGIITGKKNPETTPTQDLKTTSNANVTASDRKASPRSESLENITEYLSTIEPTKNVKTNTMNEITQTKAEKVGLETTPSLPVKKQREENITEATTIIDQMAIDSEATEKLTAEKEENANVTVKNVPETVEEDNNLTALTISSASPEIKQNITSSKSSSRALLSEADFTTTKSLKSKLDEDTSNSASTIVEVKVTKDSRPITTEASWKKYTTIERKRVESSEEMSSSTAQNKDLVKAELIHTTLPIPSLEMWSEDLLSNANQLSTIRDLQTGSITTEAEMMPTLESIEQTQSETLGTVASKRAGFLDLTKRTSAHYDTSTEKNTDYRTMYEIEATDVEAQDVKKVNGYESQSQLAEDAMQEELMKEEINNNRQENAKMYADDKFDVKPLSDITKSIYSDTNQTMTATDDSLSVQPINQDRRTTLYTVGPNYKPMKRIEVQPAKPFVRDPDDNSWRNESISSLGIVFKPKNSSSKSFKEVLKTKTETEFNNLQDKDNTGDTPELRERLEKIAEGRKSKKKIGKFGEVVYTDYEESSSAERTSTFKPEIIPIENSSSETPLTLSSVDLETEVTSPMTTTETQRYWKNKLETINKVEMYKDLGLDILTTEKTKKPYNLAEYYDTTDEYDADYVTLQKIDLLRNTVPLKTTFPSLTTPSMLRPTARIIPPRFPERKPTVQYFPPTTKPQKVIMNDYDVNFEKRVELYTMTEAPKTTSPLSNVASVQMVTDRPQIRPTVKPSDFTMYTPRTPEIIDRHVYDSNNGPRLNEPHNVVINDENFNRGTYVIKHYRDFLSMAAKDEDDGSPDFVPYTEAPVRGVTLDEMSRTTEIGKTTETDYEYDSQYRKDVLNRFVDNFNQNSDRFKLDFPVLFNTSVIHRSNDDEGRVLASSNTFVRRLYGNEPIATRPPVVLDKVLENKGCEPHCDNITVELSPAYELHYYVPEQEETEEMATGPYRYKL